MKFLILIQRGCTGIVGRASVRDRGGGYRHSSAPRARLWVRARVSKRSRRTRLGRRRREDMVAVGHLLVLEVVDPLPSTACRPAVLTADNLRFGVEVQDRLGNDLPQDHQSLCTPTRASAP